VSAWHVEALGVDLGEALLDLALTHRSWAYENGGVATNERLEFLGDSVLGVVVTDALYRRHPDLPEGQLAKMRAGVVSARALAEVARGIGLGDHVKLGKGEEATGGRGKASILADTMEALIGAVHVEHGIAMATAVVRRLFDPHMEQALEQGAGLDWKTSLQELAATRGEGAPEYVVTETGPDHAKRFAAAVRIAGVVHGQGEGSTKKEAELQAAGVAWRALSPPDA
jgi:ribonuclease-3